MKYEQDKEIIFNEEAHTYTKNGIKYCGVNELLKKYFLEFDTDSMAQRCVGTDSYKGMTKLEIIEKWKTISELSTHKGKTIHKVFELYIKGKKEELSQLLIERPEYSKYLEMVIKFFTPLPTDQAEIILSSDKYQLAGTADFLGHYNGELCIIDWKTNKEIKTIANSNMLPPFESFKGHDMNKYIFQLNIYKRLLKLAGIDVKHLYLGHVGKDEIKLIKLEHIDEHIDKLFELRLNDIVVVEDKPKIKKPFNPARFGMCCNQAHEEYLKYDDWTTSEMLTRIKHLYYLYEELEDELK